jgi:hypothetical protein
MTPQQMAEAVEAYYADHGKGEKPRP